MGPKYRSKALRSLHEAAKDLRDVGALDDAKFARFTEKCTIKATNVRRPRTAPSTQG